MTIATAPRADSPTTPTAGRLVTGGLLIAGALAVNVAFAGLGAAFDYPAVLDKPAGQVLTTFGDNQMVIGALFLLLAAGAALLAPISIRIGRLHQSRALRASVPIGIAAAGVQVVGLLRWPLLVPGLADTATDPASATAFTTLNLVLGTLIGETLGYALTAAWTVLVVVGLWSPQWMPRSLGAAGIVSAALIVAGVAEPLVPAVGLINFAGYIVWSIWLIAFAIALVRRPTATDQPDDQCDHTDHRGNQLDQCPR
jgi:MFS family permease